MPGGQYHRDHYEAVELSILPHKERCAAGIAAELFMKPVSAAAGDGDLFGRDMTKEDAVRYLFGDQHEHLGQSIAYARSNGVVPPWSK